MRLCKSGSIGCRCKAVEVGRHLNDTLTHYNAILTTMSSVISSATVRDKWRNPKECGLCHL